jgi:RND family efflux transporter MFP subunit
MTESPKRPIRLYVAGVVAVLVVVGGVLALLFSRLSAAKTETKNRTAEVTAGPFTTVTNAKTSSGGRSLTLQGEARPFASVTLYAKVSGYLRSIAVDKGDRVKAGQVLGVIESAELDKQYEAARADEKYKRANAARMANLAAQGVSSQQDAELAKSAADVSSANVASLAQQKSYEVLKAPFDGVVTARYADAGALVQNAANAQTSALPVVTISQPERLRVSVYVDQRDAAALRVGDAATVRLPERGAAQTEGRVSRIASELDPRTRMMLAEIDLDNRGAGIVPGSFVEVILRVGAPSLVEVPVAALVLRGKDPFVAVVDGEDRVKYVPVVLQDEDGETVHIARGIASGTRIALDLGDTVADGSRVRPVETKPAK